jgi:dihydroneopterin aldolase
LTEPTTHDYLLPRILRRMAWSEKNAEEDRILLEGMVFHGHHGTLPAERELGQPFVVEIELRLDLRPAGLSDDLTQTVDYGGVHRRAREIVEGAPVNLVETVAERIAAAVLEDHPAVEAVRVKVAKPHVRLDDTVLAGSAVEILRRRDTGRA